MTDEKNQTYERKTIFCRVDQQSTEGFVERRELSSGERFQRTAKISGLLFLGAVITLFVPILHFILVPSFLLASIVFGVMTWLDRAEIRRGEFPCPQCHKLNTLEKQSESFPLTTRCTHCFFTLKLSDKPS